MLFVVIDLTQVLVERFRIYLEEYWRKDCPVRTLYMRLPSMEYVPFVSLRSIPLDSNTSLPYPWPTAVDLVTSSGVLFHFSQAASHFPQFLCPFVLDFNRSNPWIGMRRSLYTWGIRLSLHCIACCNVCTLVFHHIYVYFLQEIIVCTKQLRKFTIILGICLWICILASSNARILPFRSFAVNFCYIL